MSQLTTISSTELRKLSERDLLEGLADMSPGAIDRFRRMRKLSTEHDKALNTFLRKNPEKRLTASTRNASKAPIKAKTKSKAAPKKLKPKAKSTVKVRTEDDGYVQLWSRMRAWWDGVDLEPTVQKTKTKKAQDFPDLEVSPEQRLKDRLKVIQQLWGAGNSLPGNSSMTLRLLEGTKPSATTTIADLSAGLGGGARHIASKTGATVHGFERDEALAKVAQEISEQTDFTERATILTFDPDNPGKVLDKARYDIIVARDLLCYLEDRKVILGSIVEALKPDGSFVFTDLTLADRSNENKSVIEWRQAEPSRPYPATADEYREALTELHFDVKSMDDITDEYVPAIQTGWKVMVESLKVGSFSRSYVDTLMEEGQVWLARARALETGQLRMTRCRAVMQKGPKRSLTDSMSID